MNFHIITLFPSVFSSYVNESIIGRAQKDEHISLFFYNPRDFVTPSESQKKNEKPYLRVDDKPYGGGPGMVIQAEPVAKAIDEALSFISSTAANASAKKSKVLIIYLAPRAEHFTTTQAKQISKKYTDVIIVCGRYEGIDARIKKIHKGIEISIGEYVVTGGELPAMILIDCISRQIEGVLGDMKSLEESRISSSEMYTRPEVLHYQTKFLKKNKNLTLKVPKILLSGDHKKIEEWKEKNK